LQVFERLDRKGDGYIDKDEIKQQFLLLGYMPKRQTDYGLPEEEDIVWEVRILCFLSGTDLAMVSGFEEVPGG